MRSNLASTTWVIESYANRYSQVCVTQLCGTDQKLTRSKEEKESVEVDSELDKPGKPNGGTTRSLKARYHHCHRLGRGGECQELGSASSKINNKRSA